MFGVGEGGLVVGLDVRGGWETGMGVVWGGSGEGFRGPAMGSGLVLGRAAGIGVGGGIGRVLGGDRGSGGGEQGGGVGVGKAGGGDWL